MPLFEYHCDDCTAEFEVLQRASDVNSPLECPKCGALNPTKRFSAFATTGTQKETASDPAT
ncbi:zinc ribbon domain-containing protein [Candidatus Poribacteria bacterium]|nr:zinc ribbon domain-containing protein [Candidatus Poribacteria bacterium]